ncbi:MAG: carbohydrate kinase family protein [Methanobacteriota archaeon]
MAASGAMLPRKENFLGVFGHTTIDHIIEVPKFPEPNTSIEVASHTTYRGGTGANIAFIAGGLGVPVALASFVGDDFPSDFREALGKAGVDSTDLKVVKGYTTPTCWIMTEPGQDQVAVINQGPMRDAAKFPVARHSVDSSRYVHICTGRPEYYAKVVAYAKRKGKMVSFDPGQELHYVYTPESFRAILRQSDIFFANESEARRALKYLKLKQTGELLEHVDTLVLTRGKKGSEVLTCDEKFSIPIVEADRFEDPTGAGDGYRAGFYAGLHRGFGLRDAAMAGAAAASFIIEAKGCQTNPPTWAKLESRLRKRGMKLEGC